MAVWAYKGFYGEDSITLNDCILFYSREKLEVMQNVLLAAHSSLDEPDDSFDKEDDGGEAEGKTITPLQKKVDISEQTKEERLIKDDENPEIKGDKSNEKEGEKAKTEEEPAPKNQEKPLNSKKIPSWAIKK